MDKRLFYLLNLAQHRVFKWTDAQSKERLGVSSTQLAALFFLLKQDGCRLKDMCTGLSLNNSAITGLVQRMEANGLINREACEEDGRAGRVRLSKKGRKLGEKALVNLKEYNAALSEGFSEVEINTVLRFLNVTAERFK